MSEKFIYAILGPGVSGKGARNLLQSKDIRHLAIGPDNLKEWGSDFSAGNESLVCIGENDSGIDKYFDGLKYLVLSPGIPRSHPLVEKFIKAKKEVINEIDLAYLFNSSGTYIGVTGTYGKPTTVTLIDHILKTAN